MLIHPREIRGGMGDAARGELIEAVCAGALTDLESSVVESQRTILNIPPKNNRKGKNNFSPTLYKHRNAIE